MINVVLAFMIIGSFLVAVIIHEFGHSLVATMLGDPTPRKEGRLSLSLRMHIDPIGTMLCVILAFFPVTAGPVGLGWGKPVKVDPWKLRGGPNFGTLLVTLGGILISLVVGVLFAVLLRFIPLSFLHNVYTMRITQLVVVFASVNICLAIFNLVPLYPLDGYQIVYTLLPSRQAVQFAKSAQYGPFIILGILFLLPFLAQIGGLSGFFLFHIPTYILLASNYVTSFVSGLPFDLINAVYFR
ncbi:MAG TPA: site-2 protease family protein [Ktedonobacteraceae bacterium]|nr:site-2 protease family protein [Ktedonobacteraceae bacterium]